MRRVTELLIAPAMLMLAGCEGAVADDAADEAQASVAAVETITVDELAARLQSGDIRLIDVRTPEEFAEGHIAGAQLMPVDTFDPAALGDDEVILYCRSDRRSGIAAQQLAAHRGETVVHLDGGILAWEEAGHLVVVPTP